MGRNKRRRWDGKGKTEEKEKDWKKNCEQMSGKKIRGVEERRKSEKRGRKKWENHWERGRRKRGGGSQKREREGESERGEEKG